jgi:sporulation protein YlmC with PRC-barrel domain
VRLSYVPKKALATGGVPFVENPLGQNPFRDEDAEIEDAGDRRDENPYTAMEGYELQDASSTKVGEIEETVYDAVSGVLKYVIAEGHTIPADGIEVDAENGRVRVPYEREAIESAPAPQDPSGEFDRALRAHYENHEERGL